MGTYSDESPDAGVGERVANSVKKIVASVANSTAPRSVVERKVKLQDQEGQQDPESLARMRRGQSTDTNNSYNF